MSTIKGIKINGGFPVDFTVETDNTLSVEGSPADAKKTGDEISNLKSALNHDNIIPIVTQVELAHNSSGEYFNLPLSEKNYVRSIRLKNDSGNVGYVELTFYNGNTVIGNTVRKTMYVDGDILIYIDYDFPNANKVFVKNLNSRSSLYFSAFISPYDFMFQSIKSLISNTLYVVRDYSISNNGVGDTIESFEFPELTGTERFISLQNTSGNAAYVYVNYYNGDTLLGTTQKYFSGSGTIEFSIPYSDTTRLTVQNVNNRLKILVSLIYYAIPQYNAIFYVGSGRKYTTLREGIAAADTQLNSILYVEAGEYDLVEEFGADVERENQFYGLLLKNGIHIIFSSEAIVKYHYTGSNSWALEHVSPFNAGEGGFTLENLTLECSRCRYCVHDERVQYTDRYTNKYKNCFMHLDNSNNSQWSAKQCIGGGLGTNGEIIIEDCYFQTEELGDGSAVSYHNTGASSGKSRIVFKGNYCAGLTTFAITPYGDSTEITEAFIHDNSLGSKPYIVHSDRTIKESGNVKFIDWNNEIRSE